MGLFLSVRLRLTFSPFISNTTRTSQCFLWRFGMFGLGTQEILLILVLGLVVFGAKRLPEIGSGLGRAIRSFRGALSEPDQIDLADKDGKREVKKEDGQA